MPVSYIKSPSEEISGVSIQLNGDILYMSSTLINLKVMLFIP